MGFIRGGPSIHVRSFVPIYKPFVYISDDGGSLLGPIGEAFDKKVKSFPQFNTTYVAYSGSYQFEMGKCIKNNCFGVIESIRKGKADLWLLGAPLDAFDGQTDGFVFGPGIIEMSDMITSVASGLEDVTVKPDLTTSLTAVGNDVYLALLMILTAFILIRKLSFLTHSQPPNQKSESVFQILWNIISLGAVQSVVRANTTAQRILLISFIVGFFVIVSHYYAHLNTNLVIKKTQRYIDTLTDILNSDLLPYFLKYGPTTVRFVNSSNPIYQEIWNRAGFVTIRNITTLQQLLTLMVDNKAVFIGPSMLSTLHEVLRCFFKQHRQSNLQLHFSKSSYNTILWIIFYSAQMDPWKQNQLTFLAYLALEFGIYESLANEVFGLFKNLLGMTEKGECGRNLNLVQSVRASIIQLQSLKYMFVFWLVGNTLAIVVLVIQLSLRRFKNNWKLIK